MREFTAEQSWLLEMQFHQDGGIVLSRDEMGYPDRMIKSEPNAMGFVFWALWSTVVELPIAWVQWQRCQWFGHDIECICNDAENGHEVLGCRRCGETFDCWH